MKKKLLVIIIILVVAIVGVAGAFGYNYAKSDINGNRNTKCEHTLVITPNDFQEQIGIMLKKNDIIKSNVVWSFWMSKNYPNFVYLNGEYNVNSSMSYEEIAEKLQNPDVSHKKVKVVIPEGYNCMEIAQTLEENEICKADEFLEACKNASDYEYEFLDTVPNNKLIAYQLEGFLFPATYDFAQNSEPKDIIATMLETFDYHYSTKMKNYCKNNNVTLYELITLASVVQEEAFSTESAKNIASVFINRLEKGSKLQSDVTYFYAAKLRDEQGFSQKVYDAYYTYRCKGLPAGPITNSGDDIINAVIKHPDTDYLFFYSDLNKEFHFAKDYDEFMAQQEKYPWK